MVTHTFQAISDYERKQWVEAMGGTWPAVSTLQRIRADSVEDNLNSSAFLFLKDCLAELEARGLRDHGLYRVGGVVSKVKKLLHLGLIEQAGEKIDLGDPKQWESKTIASAVKQYFRDLSKPLMTHQLYPAFLEAAKNPELQDEEDRAAEIAGVARRLPRASWEMLRVLVTHLSKVASNSDVNLMTAANLGVCFGPTLLRPKEETVASIMDIKFCNEVVEVLIQNCDKVFPPAGDSSPELPTAATAASVASSRRKHSSSANSTASVSTSLGGGGGGGGEGGAPVNGGGEDTPDRVVRGGSTPQRTGSVGSFSQLSTNSLPDFKDFRPVTRSGGVAASSTPYGGVANKARSKSHQHEQVKLEVPSVRKQASLPSPYYGNNREQGDPPKSPLKTMKSSQDDLMASLEMMNLLAADLPSTKVSSSSSSSTPPHQQRSSLSPLKRSYTLQPQPASVNGGGGGGGGQDVFRKPPLPKLSLTASHPYTAFLLRSNPSPSPSLSSNSGESAASASASPRIPPRVSSTSSTPGSSDLLTRMQEKLSSRNRSNSVDNTNYSPSSVFSASPSPPIGGLMPIPPRVPVRKYRRVIVSPSALQEHQAKVAEEKEEENGGGGADSFRSLAATIKYELSHANGDDDDAAPPTSSHDLGSPSPPTDSGVAESPPVQVRVTVRQREEEEEDEDLKGGKGRRPSEDDAASTISSSAISAESVGEEGEGEEASADNKGVSAARLSRYDNVQTRGEDGDDEATTDDDDDNDEEEEDEEEEEEEEEDVSQVERHGRVGQAKDGTGGDDDDEEREEEEEEVGRVEMRRRQQRPDVVPRMKSFPVTEEEMVGLGPAKQRKMLNRVSGPYENVRDGEEVAGGNLHVAEEEEEEEDGGRKARSWSPPTLPPKRRPRPGQSIKEEEENDEDSGNFAEEVRGRGVQVEGREERVEMEEEDFEGMNSLRRMLSGGQTSDV